MAEACSHSLTYCALPTDKMQQIMGLERAKGEGYDTIEEAVGHIPSNESDAVRSFRVALRENATMIYAHVLNRSDIAVTSPPDRLVA